MALPLEQNLPTILRGDSFNIPVKFTNDADEPIDLTGWVLIFTLKIHRMQEDSEAALQKRLSVSGMEAVIVIRPEDTNELPPYEYEYDVQLSTPDGSGVRTMLMGRIKLISGVTHSLT